MNTVQWNLRFDAADFHQREWHHLLQFLSMYLRVCVCHSLSLSLSSFSFCSSCSCFFALDLVFFFLSVRFSFKMDNNDDDHFRGCQWWSSTSALLAQPGTIIDAGPLRQLYKPIEHFNLASIWPAFCFNSLLSFFFPFIYFSYQQQIEKKNWNIIWKINNKKCINEIKLKYKDMMKILI